MGGMTMSTDRGLSTVRLPPTRMPSGNCGVGWTTGRLALAYGDWLGTSTQRVPSTPRGTSSEKVPSEPERVTTSAVESKPLARQRTCASRTVVLRSARSTLPLSVCEPGIGTSPV